MANPQVSPATLKSRHNRTHRHNASMVDRFTPCSPVAVLVRLTGRVHLNAQTSNACNQLHPVPVG